MKEAKNGAFSGILKDLQTRRPHYLNDFKDGIKAKSIASTLFLYFACLAPTITFGGIMGLSTGGHIGAMEMLLATIAVGIIWSIFSGSPLIMMGGTGPILIFTTTLYQVFQAMELPFLTAYAWVGIWSGLILIALAVFNASNLMKHFTRFTDEIFAALICFIYVVESLKALLNIFIEGYTADQINHDVPLLTILLAFGTYQIAMSLSRMRKSVFLRPTARNFLADFGPATSIILMTIVFLYLQKLDSVEILRLAVPDQIQPSHMIDGVPRSWWIDIWAGPSYLPIFAILPALLGVVLLFLDQNITARLVNSPDHKLEKGDSYHWDLTLLGTLVIVCSLLGLPWLVAATVRSINHVKSLASYKPQGSDETHSGVEKIQAVQENRVTPLAIYTLMGCSLLFLPFLKMIPMAVLYGIFLYMGIVSFGGNQFFDRLSLWITDPELYPMSHYRRKVPMRVINKFTFIQVICLGVLWFIKASVLGILFPLFIALLVPIRLKLKNYFDKEHLEYLDADEIPDEEESRWA